MNKREIGGNHYSKYQMEPVDLMVILGFNWFQGEILKYISRHKDKGKSESLDKAISVAQLALDRGLGYLNMMSNFLINQHRSKIIQYCSQLEPELGYYPVYWRIIIDLIRNDYKEAIKDITLLNEYYYGE